MSANTFKEPNGLNDVKKFHELFDLPVLETPQIPDEKRCSLRVSLLQEELDELKEAIENQDIIGIADALSDLQYVLSGAVLEFGLGGKFKKLFDEVLFDFLCGFVPFGRLFARFLLQCLHKLCEILPIRLGDNNGHNKIFSSGVLARLIHITVELLHCHLRNPCRIV